MFLKAGALSLALLVASRVLGLLRETALAAAFGASGQADIAVLMFTLPDIVAGLFASGALAYVLVPYWAGPGASSIADSQRLLARVLLGTGAALGVLLALFAAPAAGWLAGGLGPELLGAAARGLRWSAIAVPAALLAALWSTRAQHERDFAGLYGGNLVVNATLVAGVGAVAFAHAGRHAVDALGFSLVLAGVLRLAWLAWRNRRALAPPALGRAAPLPRPAVWAWAALSAGLPLALPLAARSVASHGGEGALASFNYAWKLVELPLVLALQLVSTLAFPAIARAAAAGTDPRDAARPAAALAWTLACAAAAGLLAGAPAATALLFGWGKMSSAGLADIAAWGQAGAWGLLPQALALVALNVLATQGRLRASAAGYAAGLALVLAAGALGLRDGRALMWVLNAALLLVCLVSLAATGRGSLRRLPLRAMAAAGAALAAVALAAAFARDGIAALPVAAGIAAAAMAAMFVVAVAAVAAPDVRGALRR